MNTYGWDVVCACSGHKLNELLALQFVKTPASLSYDDNAGTQIDAQVDAWRIIAGGSNKKLRFELPVKAGSLDTPLVSVTLDGVVIVAELELAFVTNATASASNLQFNFTAAVTQSGDPTVGGIFIVNADRDGRLAKLDPSGNAKMALHDCVPQCLIANRAKIAYILTTLNLTPAGDGSWLAPRSPRYVFVQGAPGQIGYLAILSMVSGADTSKLPSDVDPALCDGQSDACIAFATHVFLEHVVMPRLPASYVGASGVNFAMQGDSIVNVGPLVCQPVSHWGTGYQPILTSLQITIAASDLRAAAAGAFNITGLAKSYVTFSESGKMRCSYDATAGTLSLVQDGTPTPNYEKHIPWYIYAAAAPAILFLGPVLPIVVGAIVDGIIEGVSSAVANSVAASSGNLALSNWSAQSIQFPGCDRWIVRDAALSDAFYLRCMLHH